jgi:hypothetical protein
VDAQSAPGQGDRPRLVALAACFAASLALYGLLATLLGSPPAGGESWVGFSLPSAPLFRAFTGFPPLALTPAAFSGALAATLVALWLLLGAAVLLLRGIAGAAARRQARAIVIAGAVVMLGLVVVAAPPLLSTDLYRQAIYGRMVLHGINPYSTLASAVHDPLQALATQTTATTTYGAAYTWLSALTVALFPSNPLGVALGWKTMSALAALGCALLAAPVARALAGGGSERHADEARLWLAWNPLIIIEAAGSGHTESLMMLPALAGLLLLARGRPLRGVALLAVSTLVKWVTGVLLLLAALREMRGAAPERRWRLALRLAGTAGLVALLYLPFARGLGSSGGIHAMALHGASSFGAGKASALPQWARMAAFAAVTLLGARFATGGDLARLVAVSSGLVLTFVLLVVPWLFPWYLVAPIVLAVVLPPGRSGELLRLVSLGLGAGLMFYYAKLIPLP